MIYQTNKKNLLPTNGSDYANKALKHAVWFASASASEIIALNVIKPYSLATLPKEHIKIQILELLKEEGNKALQKIFDLLKPKTDENYPEKIKLLLGSLSEKVVMTAPCPVLIVH